MSGTESLNDAAGSDAAPQFVAGVRVKIRDDSPTAWVGQAGEIVDTFPGTFWVRMDSSRTNVLFYPTELEPA